jgi:hypothetical protein
MIHGAKVNVISPTSLRTSRTPCKNSVTNKKKLILNYAHRRYD